MIEGLAIKVIAGIAALIVVIVALPRLFGRAARIRRRLRAAPQCAVRDLGAGGVAPRCIAGMVVPVGEPLISPLTGRVCVFYETRVERRLGLDRDFWNIDYSYLTERRSVAFLVDDGTGTAVVDAQHAELLLESDVDRWSTARDPGAAAEDAFLARHRKRRRGLLFEKKLRFTESIIEVGERVAVRGVAMPTARGLKTPDEGPYRQLPPHTESPGMTLSSTQPLIITDDQRFAPALDDE